MALTQMQIIQSLGDAMSWFERELQWGVQPTEIRHLVGRIGELYAALITNGQMAPDTNQRGYDVVSAEGEKVSVKTTAMMQSSGHISFNQATLEEVDRVIILRINTQEMQVEILLNGSVEEARSLMSFPEAGKASISLSKLVKTKKKRDDIPVAKRAQLDGYEIVELESGTMEVWKDRHSVSPVLPILRSLAERLGVSILNGNGNPFNTRQLGSNLIKAAEQPISLQRNR